MGVGAGWYYDSLDGMVVHQNLAESIPNAAFPYYHGPYLTEALALAHAGVTGPPATTNASVAAQVGTAVANLTGINAIGDFFTRLSQGNTWLRVGEVLAGGLLLTAGVIAITEQTKAGKTAGKAFNMAATKGIL